jgi:uncharacterized protein YlxW (UPF0749 family)
VSESVSLEFIGRRLDSVQADVADVRRRMAGFVERFESVEANLDHLRAGVGRLDTRMGLLETRMDAMVERQSKQEELLQRTLLMTQRIAAKLGVDGDGP